MSKVDGPAHTSTYFTLLLTVLFVGIAVRMLLKKKKKNGDISPWLSPIRVDFPQNAAPQEIITVKSDEEGYSARRTDNMPTSRDKDSSPGDVNQDRWTDQFTLKTQSLSISSNPLPISLSSTAIKATTTILKSSKIHNAVLPAISIHDC